MSEPDRFTSQCPRILQSHGLDAPAAVRACADLYEQHQRTRLGGQHSRFLASEAEAAGDFASFDNETDWINSGLTLLCVCCAALAAGLTMGLVSLEAFDLRIKERSGSEQEKRLAKKLLPLVTNTPHHQVQ